MIKITCTLFLQIQCISPIQALNFLELYHDIQIPSQTRLITHAPQFLPSISHLIFNSRLPSFTIITDISNGVIAFTPTAYYNDVH